MASEMALAFLASDRLIVGRAVDVVDAAVEVGVAPLVLLPLIALLLLALWLGLMMLEEEGEDPAPEGFMVVLGLGNEARFFIPIFLLDPSIVGVL